MLAVHLWIFISILHLATAYIDVFSSFIEPQSNYNEEGQLEKRQGCGNGYTSCSNIGAPYACCPSGTFCQTDSKGNAGCCPNGGTCTGSINVTINPSATASLSSGSTGTPTVTGTATAVTVTVTPGVTAIGSTYYNNYYPFVYAPTTFANIQDCYNAVATCNAQSSTCFTNLAGLYGVTIAGPGASVSYGGVGSSAASSICSSISGVACFNLNTASCTPQYGSDTTVTAYGSTFVQRAAGPRKTSCPGIVYAAGAGVVAGLIGVMA